MRELTDRQRAVLRCIVQSISSRGYPPTLREIGSKLGIRSTNGVNDHLKALEKKGYLTRDDQKSRALVPTERGRRVVLGGKSNVVPFPGSDRSTADDAVIEVPIHEGRVAAGPAGIIDEHASDSVHIDKYLLGTSQPVFGVRVAGDSMIEDGILDGDYVFVRQQPTAPPGSVVLAYIDENDGATVKRFFPERDRIRFQPANSALKPIYVPRADFDNSRILGVVVGVYRQLR